MGAFRRSRNLIALLFLLFLMPVASFAQIGVSIRLAPLLFPSTRSPHAPRKGICGRPGTGAMDPQDITGSRAYGWLLRASACCGPRATGVLQEAYMVGMRDTGDRTSVSMEESITASASAESVLSAVCGQADRFGITR